LLERIEVEVDDGLQLLGQRGTFEVRREVVQASTVLVL